MAQPDGLGLRAVLEEPSFAVEGAGPDAPAFDRAALLEALAQPVLWVERAPGRIEQIRGQRGLPGAARDLWYLAVSLVELVRPESPAPSWRTVEQDGMGRFRARYHFEPTGGALLKEKLVYTEPAGGRLGIGVAPEYEIESSRVRFELDPDQGLMALQASDHVVARSEPPVPSLGARTELEPQLAQQGLDRLVDGLGKAQSPADQIAFLKALGNASQASTLDVLERYAKEPSDSIRAAAVRALRRIPGARADGLLAAAASADSSEQVRQAAVTAIRGRSPSAALSAALVTALRGDSSRSVRQAALQCARLHMGEAPQLQQAIQWVALHDADSQLREAAARAMARQ